MGIPFHLVLSLDTYHQESMKPLEGESLSLPSCSPSAQPRPLLFDRDGGGGGVTLHSQWTQGRPWAKEHSRTLRPRRRLDNLLQADPSCSSDDLGRFLHISLSSVSITVDHPSVVKYTTRTNDVDLKIDGCDLLPQRQPQILNCSENGRELLFERL
jgi:hypothetical protein